MRVLATAGHVDHGKSTLVRSLTGMEPDRLDEEQRRGLTVDLGFAWTELDQQMLAFVDVPGHERFVPNMLAGVGPVTAALFVVAADAGWQTQSEEHLAALDALGVRHGVLAVTKSDRADPTPVALDAQERIGRTSLGEVPVVTVDGHSGSGVPQLRAELAAMAADLPPADPAADVRLWVDRAFSLRGTGTVVTGTLAAGTIRVGDELDFTGTGTRATVRGLQALGQDRTEVCAVARVAVNLRGLHRERIRRGAALLTPGVWRNTREVDVRLWGDKAEELTRQLILHIGAAAVPCRPRPLGSDTARLSLVSALPLRVGDVGLLRSSGEQRVVAGVEMLDVHPPELPRRGAARTRARELDTGDPLSAYVHRHRVVHRADLHALGWGTGDSGQGEWVTDPQLLAELPGRVQECFREWEQHHPLSAGMSAEALRRMVDVPNDLLTAVLADTDLEVDNGVVRRPGAREKLPAAVEEAVTVLEKRFAAQPFRAPEAGELDALGLGTRQLAAAERAGRLVRITENVVLPPEALPHAARLLADIPGPFTVSQARRTLDTTRRIAVPLLEKLDAEGFTQQHADTTRTIR